MSPPLPRRRRRLRRRGRTEPGRAHRRRELSALTEVAGPASGGLDEHIRRATHAVVAVGADDDRVAAAATEARMRLPARPRRSAWRSRSVRPPARGGLDEHVGRAAEPVVRHCAHDDRVAADGDRSTRSPSPATPSPAWSVARSRNGSIVTGYRASRSSIWSVSELPERAREAGSARPAESQAARPRYRSVRPKTYVTPSAAEASVPPRRRRSESGPAARGAGRAASVKPCSSPQRPVHVPLRELPAAVLDAVGTGGGRGRCDAPEGRGHSPPTAARATASPRRF